MIARVDVVFSRAMRRLAIGLLATAAILAGCGGASSRVSGNLHPVTQASETNPAPPSVLDGLKGVSGKVYEERSKALPDVIETR
jgi:hypothetical protein